MRTNLGTIFLSTRILNFTTSMNNLLTHKIWMQMTGRTRWAYVSILETKYENGAERQPGNTIREISRREYVYFLSYSLFCFLREWSSNSRCQRQTRLRGVKGAVEHEEGWLLASLSLFFFCQIRLSPHFLQAKSFSPSHIFPTNF